MATHNSKMLPLVPVIRVTNDGLLQITDRIAPPEALYAIVRAIVDAGFLGVHTVTANGTRVIWRFQPDTPEGACFEQMCRLARLGCQLPSPETVLAFLCASNNSTENRE